jgi:hypothetical protein
MRIPRISATQSTGMLPRNPRECCHPVQRISATQSTGMLPSSLQHGWHPRSIATLDRMSSLGSLLLSMAVASAVHFFAVLPPGQQRRSSPMRRTPRPSDNAASRWSLGVTRCGACLIYADGALTKVACRLRMESPFKAILYALWTSRSRIASARVGSPIAACQCSTGSWLVTIVARQS